MCSQHVNKVMPEGIPCQNPSCPYNDIAYFQSTACKPNDPYHGKCLNCLDDERKANEYLEQY